MAKVQYRVTGPSYDGKYGIVVSQQRNKRNVVTMPFIKDEEEAQQLVAKLNEKQVQISLFCDAFAGGDLSRFV